jgi:hypothetical protein
LLNALTSVQLEDARDEFEVFVFEETEQLDREVKRRSTGEQGLARFSAVVEVDWSVRPPFFSTRSDEPSGFEDGQVLAEGARGSSQGLRQGVA